MKRRNFLKISLATPLFFESILKAEAANQPDFLPAAPNRFDLLEVSGSYRQIGYEIGKRFRKNIREIIRSRKDWHNDLLAKLDSPEGKSLAAGLKRQTQRYFPQFLEEIEGMADGAGLAFHALWAISIKSELGCVQGENPGCSTIFVKHQNKMWLFHNEDGDTAYRDLMFLVRVHPPSGISYVSMVYPGILTGNGPSLNSRGIIQTTNYIGSTQAEPGIPRYVLGRAVLEAKDLAEAVQIVTMHPRAFPYHHNLASLQEQRYVSVETVPDASEASEPYGIYYHTNHLILEGTREYPYEDQEYKKSSSLSRYSVLEEELSKIELSESIKPEDFLAILSSHQNAPYSPCRHPQGGVQGQTLGTAFYDATKGSFRLYRGNSCQSVPGALFSEYRF